MADFSVTSLAGYLAQDHVPSMRKKDMIGLFVEPFPRDFLFFLLKLPDSLLFLVLREFLLVTLQTGCQLWHAGKGLFFEIGVAGETIDALFLVFLVIEGDGLPRLQAKAEADEEEEKRKADYESKEKEFHLLESPGSC